jgi:hypothetical protein
VERCRSAPSGEEFFSFSFGKLQNSPRGSKREGEANKDNAFMFHSFSQEGRSVEGLVGREDFELELIIKEIQRENWEKMDSRTFSSDIASNQENEGFIREPQPNGPTRRPFEVLLEAEAKAFPKQESVGLEELMDFDDDLRNPEEVFFEGAEFESGQKRREQG